MILGLTSYRWRMVLMSQRRISTVGESDWRTVECEPTAELSWFLPLANRTGRPRGHSDGAARSAVDLSRRRSTFRPLL